MKDAPRSMEDLEQKITQWGLVEPAVRAAIVVGSRARSDHPADEWADLDVLLFVRRREQFLADLSWARPLGNIWASTHARDISGNPEWLVTFEGGLDVDFVLMPATATRWSLAAMIVVTRFPLLRRLLPPSLSRRLTAVEDPGSDTVRKGMRVLVDKEGFADRLRRAFSKPPQSGIPRETEFVDLLNQFWVQAERTAKKLRRGELWVASMWCNSSLKELLLRMVEWHTAACGNGRRSWHAGRFLEEWADPRAVAALPSTFAGYGVVDTTRAIGATIDAFRWLSRETAESLMYRYPLETDEHMGMLADALLRTP